MEVRIEQVVSVVGSIDGDAVLSPKALERIIQTVVEELNRRGRGRPRRSSTGQAGQGRLKSVSITIRPDTADDGQIEETARS